MKLLVNGADVEIDDRHANTPLLWVIRDVLGLRGTKFGGGAGFCAACTADRRAQHEGPPPRALLEQRRLAHARLPAEHQRTASRGSGLVEQRCDRLDLALASAQHDAMLRPFRSANPGGFGCCRRIDVIGCPSTSPTTASRVREDASAIVKAHEPAKARSNQAIRGNARGHAASRRDVRLGHLHQSSICPSPAASTGACRRSSSSYRADRRGGKPNRSAPAHRRARTPGSRPLEHEPAPCSRAGSAGTLAACPSKLPTFAAPSCKPPTPSSPRVTSYWR